MISGFGSDFVTTSYSPIEKSFLSDHSENARFSDVSGVCREPPRVFYLSIYLHKLTRG